MFTYDKGFNKRSIERAHIGLRISFRYFSKYVGNTTPTVSFVALIAGAAQGVEEVTMVTIEYKNTRENKLIIQNIAIFEIAHSKAISGEPACCGLHECLRCG